jgi:hypothetical protein
MNTAEQNTICEEFLKYTFQLVQRENWHWEKQYLFQLSKEKNGETDIECEPVSVYSIDGMTFQYVVENCTFGDEDFALKLWYTRAIFKDEWFEHWINIHHPDSGLNKEHMKDFYDNMGGIIALKHKLGIDDIEIK